MTPPLRAVANPSQLTLEGQRVAQKCQWWPLFALFIRPSFLGEAKSARWKIYPITIAVAAASVMSLHLKDMLGEEMKITFGCWILMSEVLVGYEHYTTGFNARRNKVLFQVHLNTDFNAFLPSEAKVLCTESSPEQSFG